MCTASDCPASVRFDQGPLKTYGTYNANGVSMRLINRDDFLANTRTCKRVNTVFPLTQDGNVVFTFDISGYEW